ncbi:MAG: 30S ribosomal protein S18 [candidate division WOR-3 bacterium]
MPKKKKTCEFCKLDIRVIDYKDTETLRRYITQRGKMLSRRSTGLCAYHQRRLSVAIKRARIMALLPFVQSYYT